MSTEPPRPRPRRRRFAPTWGDLGRAALALLGAAAGLEIATWIVPDFTLPDNVFLVAVLVFVWGVVLRPVLVWLAVLMGWFGAALVGLFGQAIIIMAATYDPTDGDSVSLLGALLASWIVAAVSTLLVYLATAGTSDAVTASVLRRARRRPVTVDDPEVAGIVFVQIDGFPYPVLESAVRGGTLPTLSRWIRSGEYVMAEWRPKLPATTPASQMGILHGTIDGIPAFRWIERAEGRTYVANKPADAAVIEARHSNGRGLLADDGVSVSNLFTGDAPTAYATMSAIERTQETRETRLALSRYLASPAGMARGIPRVLTEVVREWFQASQAVRRDIRPRVHRGWSFTVERAGLTGVMRDLNTALVADSMLKGRRAIYVDYVDYDAIAHHAGILRPESLAALVDIDAVLAQLEQICEVTPRPYHLVVLSDHGQSQGEVFADRYGEDLAALVARLAGTETSGTAESHEGVSSLNSVVAGSSSDDSVLGRALQRTSDRIAASVEEEPEAAADSPTDHDPGTHDGFVVFGSGNLGLVYVADQPRRIVREELDQWFPDLVPGLAAHPGVAFVVVDSREDGPVVIGADGEHHLVSGTVHGTDPLAPFGPHAPGFVLRAARMPQAPDLYVNSLLDDLGEVAAFEGLVGCHGGLGGWQDRAVLVHPAGFEAPEEMVVGADAMHRVLVEWLERLGHRRDLREGPPADQDRAAEPT